MTQASKISDIPKGKHFGVLAWFNIASNGSRDSYDVDGFNYHYFDNEDDLLAWVAMKDSYTSYVIIEAIPRTVKRTLELSKTDNSGW